MEEKKSVKKITKYWFNNVRLCNMRNGTNSRHHHKKKHIHSKYCYKNGSHLIECQFRAFEFHKSGTETEPFYKISKQPSPSELSNPRFYHSKDRQKLRMYDSLWMQTVTIQLWSHSDYCFHFKHMCIKQTNRYFFLFFF